MLSELSVDKIHALRCTTLPTLAAPAPANVIVLIGCHTHWVTPLMISQCPARTSILVPLSVIAKTHRSSPARARISPVYSDKSVTESAGEIHVLALLLVKSISTSCAPLATYSLPSHASILQPLYSNMRDSNSGIKSSCTAPAESR